MKTALYDLHKEMGGVIVDFAGYELPVQYADGIIAEHRAVREAAALFDVSHMGEIMFEGENAEAALNYLLSNDISGMDVGRVRYAILTNEKGGAVDDVLVYKMGENKFFVVVNAVNTDKDFEHMKQNLKSGAQIYNLSGKISQIALQGVKSEEILTKLVGKESIPEKNYTFKTDFDLFKDGVLISRTGYTAEDGFELYVKNADAERVYRMLLEAGKEYGLVPAGLGARDTLRLEGAMPLYGHELSDDYLITEVALDFAVKPQKGDFIGRSAVISTAPQYVRIGAFVNGRGIAREGAEVVMNGETVGKVTSGTFSPTLGKAICMLRIKKGYELSDALFANVRGKMLPLTVTPLPFYKRKK